MDDVLPFISATIVSGVLALFTGVVLRVYPSKEHSRLGSIISAVPPFLLLILFYSLAIHMRFRLGEWPNYIGEQGFPGTLITHANLATSYFACFIVFTIIGVPAILLALVLARRTRKYIPCFGSYFVSCFLCFGLMAFAPSQFLHWWWD